MNISPEDIKAFRLFSELRGKDLKDFAKIISVRKLKKGEILYNEGDQGDEAHLIKEGELEVYKIAGGEQVFLVNRVPGEVVGEIALFEGVKRTATVKAAKDVVLYTIKKDDFLNLLKKSFNATKVVLAGTLGRWQETENILRQSEKMAQLGILTAGITHELNNPISAVQRGVQSALVLLDKYNKYSELTAQKDFSKKQLTTLKKLLDKSKTKAKMPSEMDPLARADKEEEIEKWLNELGVLGASELTSHLVNSGYSRSELRDLSQEFKGDDLDLVISWICTTYEFYSLLNEISLGSMQVAELVKALKSYSYLDRAPIQDVDIHKGIEDTLIILRNKLKKGVSVVKYFDPGLPTIEGFGSELNQVWTNLIDNAVDAMDGHGTITIRTNHNKKHISVEIEDNGPGIPDTIKEKIFNPFFTTKEPGKGTGLGLDISYNIIVHKHKGDISFKSEKGKTVFYIKLPRSLKS